MDDHDFMTDSATISQSRCTGVCIGCGYDLRGGDPPRCPECGLERPPGAIDLLVTTTERSSIKWSIVLLGFFVSLLVAAPFLHFRGVSPGFIALLVVAVPAVTLFMLRLARHLGGGLGVARQQDAVRFTEAGVACRHFGSWSTVMPYDELDRFDLRRRRSVGPWRYRVAFVLLGFTFSFVRGTVLLDDRDAAFLRAEFNRRIQDAKQARSKKRHAAACED